jgi:hypothetical protein
MVSSQNAEASFNFDFDLYSSFDFSYTKQYLRYEVFGFIREKKFRTQFRITEIYCLTFDDLRERLSKFGEVWGGNEYFVLNDNYVIFPTILSVDGGGRVSIVFSGVTHGNYDKELILRIEDEFGEFKKSELSVIIDWAVETKGEISYHQVQSVFDEEILSESYPYVSDLDGYIDRFLKGKENILVLIGPPGTGKTRFIKYVVSRISKFKAKKSSPIVLYTMDEKVFHKDSFFLRFLIEDYDALILEDIDFNLKSRKQGNSFMYKLLGGSDGIIKNPSKKILLSTNMPNISDIDEALLRPGRCYDVLRTRRLNREEALSVANKLGLKLLDKAGSDPTYSLSEIYNGKIQS